MNRFRLSKEAVLSILDDIDDLGNGTQRISSVSPLNQLLITLRYYATGNFLSVNGDLFGVHKCTVSRVIKKVSRAIASLYKYHIKFPAGNRILDVQRAFMQQSGIPGVVGLIDCTHIPIISPGGGNAELFRNRKGFFSINVQAICDHELKLTNVVVRWPGSTHDSRIFENSNICAKFERREINGILLGDNGYPLRSYLVTPVLTPNSREERRFNLALCNTRVKIENVFGILKRRFPCLRQQLRLKLQTNITVITACCVLYNIARELSIPLPNEDDCDDNDDVPVPVLQNYNQGGRALRTILIRNFR